MKKQWGDNGFYLYSLGSRRYPFLGVVYNWKLRNSHQFWNQRTSKVCLNFNSLSSSLRIDNHLEVHEFYFLGNWFLLNLAWVAPSFGYSFRFSTTQVTCAWNTHGTYDLTSVSDRTVVPDPREGSGDLIVHDYMRALSCSHEVSTTSPDTAACEGQDFRRTIHAWCTFWGTFNIARSECTAIFPL